MTRRVLIVDDDRAVREALGQTLELADCDVTLAGSFVEAKDHLTRDFPGVVVSDVAMPGRDGFHLLDFARAADPDLPVILLTGQGDIPMAVEAMRRGAFSFLEKPCSPATLRDGVDRALDTRRAVLTDRRLKVESATGDAAARLLQGGSPQAQALRQSLRQIARTGADVLVTGEAGTGTPKVAEVIHLLSSAARQPFVKRTGAALDEAALGAAFETAGRGTVFVDEVGDLGTAAQAALLDLLEQRPAARLIAGSTVDLAAKVAEGAFLGSLCERIELVRVRIPPLRERMEDVPVLFRHYVTQACEQANLAVPDIPETVIARHLATDWPGNARALMNAAMQFALSGGAAQSQDDQRLPEQMARIERRLIEDALRRHGGNATETARALGLPRKTFYDKLARHDLRAEDYRG